MTRTEDRLTAALKAAAAEVRDEDMRPLVAPKQSRLTRRGRGRRAWLAAGLPAAASIAVIAVLVAVNGQRPSPRVVTAAYIGGSEPRVPAFFVDAGSTGLYDQKLRVVSLATGAVTATERAPAGTADITFLAEQAQTGNYVAAFMSRQGGGLVLYRFRITGTGAITPLIRIGRILPGQQPENITAVALSPDGSRLALSLSANNIPAPAGTADTKIILLDLRNGSRQVWRDRLFGRAYWPKVPMAVFTGDGRTLVFASQICRLYPHENDCSWEIRKLAADGRGLQAGPVLLRKKGTDSEIPPLALTPDGSSFVEVRSGAGPGTDDSLVRVSLATGSQTVLHRWHGSGPYQVGASEGNFLFVFQPIDHGNNARLAGWVNGDGFHTLRYPKSF